MPFHQKRRRPSTDDVNNNNDPVQQPPRAQKRSRRHNGPEYITRLSDEIFLRIVSFFDTADLLSFQRVSKRFQRIAVDGQVWKALYHRRFVRPRASRFGLRKQHQREYNARDSTWLEGEGISQDAVTDWKALYKLRHNWNRGSCGVREINITDDHSTDKSCMTDDEEQPSTTMHSGETTGGRGFQMEARDESPTSNKPASKIPSLLVKLHEGIVFTAELARGLRAWSLRNGSRHRPRGIEDTEDNLIATHDLSAEVDGTPTAIAVDKETDDGIANVTVGFDTGAFVVYQLDMRMPDGEATFRARYIHAATSTRHSNSSAVTAMAMLGPYLSIMRGQNWTIYDFARAQSSAGPAGVEAQTGEEQDNIWDPSENAPSTDDDALKSKTRMRLPPRQLQTPQILSSLLSRTVWPPLSLSLRRSANRSVLLASIVYAFPLYVSGWSVGIQELRFDGITNTRTPPNCTSRIATAVAPGFTAGSARGGLTGSPGSGSQGYPPAPPQPVALARPTSLSYSHPYLLSSHSDNTLTLYLVRSSDASFEIDRGQRLYGHTSGVSSVQVASRGKAVSLSNGREVRVWELEGGVSERRRVSASVKIEPTENHSEARVSSSASYPDIGSLGGFDEEKVVVAVDGAQLLVYDFTR